MSAAVKRNKEAAHINATVKHGGCVMQERKEDRRTKIQDNPGRKPFKKCRRFDNKGGVSPSPAREQP